MFLCVYVLIMYVNSVSMFCILLSLFYLYCVIALLYSNVRLSHNKRLLTYLLAASEENASFVQPLLQGFRDVLEEYFPPASVKHFNCDPSPGDTNNSSTDRESRPNTRSNGRYRNNRVQSRSQSPANNHKPRDPSGR